jgi:glycosyltransferase involved in cell wall biosynthesis
MDIGGAERAVYQLVREQIRSGMRADVLVASHAGFYGELASAEGAVVHELGQRRALDMPRALKAASIIRSYDIAHFQGREPVLMEIARRLRTTRLVYTHRGGVKAYSPPKRIRHRLIGRSLRNFDALSANTAQSARAASEIFRIPQDEFHVVYNGVDFSLLDPSSDAKRMRAEVGLPSDVVVVGTCAKLLALKRIDRLIRATAAVSPEVHCLVIGDGPERSKLEQLATGLGIGRRMTFVGLRDSVGDYLQLIDVFALPSGPDEGFGNSLVEAMGTGIASIIFADGGGLLEHICNGHTGLIAADQGDFERLLTELVEDSALRQRLGSSARAAVRSRYTVEAAASGYAHLYGTILAQSGTARSIG